MKKLSCSTKEFFSDGLQNHVRSSSLHVIQFITTDTLHSRGCSHFTTPTVTWQVEFIASFHHFRISYNSQVNLHCSFSNSHNTQVCSDGWSRFEDTTTYWNVGQRAYCPWPPWGTFLTISPKFHARVLVAVDMEFHPSRFSWRGWVRDCTATYSKQAVIGDKLLVVNDQQVCQWCQIYSLWRSQRHVLLICLTIWKN